MRARARYARTTREKTPDKDGVGQKRARAFSAVRRRWVRHAEPRRQAPQRARHAKLPGEALSWPPRRGSFAASEATSVPAKGKAIVKKSASGWPTGGRRMSDRADATHRHRSRCRRRTARARASDCHPLGTKVNCLSWWALTCPHERQPGKIRSRSAIESYIRTRHELAPGGARPLARSYPPGARTRPRPYSKKKRETTTSQNQPKPAKTS